MSKVTPESILEDPKVREAWKAIGEEAKQYLREFECSICGSVGQVKVYKNSDNAVVIKIKDREAYVGLCKNCDALHALDYNKLHDGLYDVCWV